MKRDDPWTQLGTMFGLSLNSKTAAEVHRHLTRAGEAGNEAMRGSRQARQAVEEAVRAAVGIAVSDPSSTHAKDEEWITAFVAITLELLSLAQEHPEAREIWEKTLSILQALVAQRRDDTFDIEAFRHFHADLREMGQKAEGPLLLGRRRIAQVPDIFRAGHTSLPTDLITLALKRAIEDAPSKRGWSDEGGEAVPTHRSLTKKGRGAVFVSVRGPDGSAVPAPDILPALWEKALALDDLSSDALFVCLARWATSADGPRSPVWVTADSILDARGVQRMRRPNEPGNWQHGHRREDRLDAGRALAQLQSLWIETTELEVIPGGKRRKPKRITVQSRAVAILDQVLQKDMLNKEAIFLAARVMPGEWAKEYWDLGLRQTGLLAQKALAYDPYHQQLEKRLAKYLTFQFRYRSTREMEAVTLKVQTILDNTSTVPDPGRPQRLRDRLEQALHCLQTDGVIAKWEYAPNVPELPSRGWLSTWLEWTVLIKTPLEIEAHYRMIH